MRSFITGSRAYGEPTEESDVDLVILVSARTYAVLVALADSAGPDTDSIRFGKLNIIVTTTEEEFLAWKFGTERMRLDHENRPFGKKQAKRIFDRIRGALDLEDEGGSG